MRIRSTESYPILEPQYTVDDELNQVLSGYTPIGSIYANIQPAGGSIKAQLYGLELSKYHSVYSEPNPLIQEARYIAYGGKVHQIQPINKWNTHYVFDVKEEGDYGG